MLDADTLAVQSAPDAFFLAHTELRRVNGRDLGVVGANFLFTMDVLQRVNVESGRLRSAS